MAVACGSAVLDKFTVLLNIMIGMEPKKWERQLRKDETGEKVKRRGPRVDYTVYFHENISAVRRTGGVPQSEKPAERQKKEERQNQATLQIERPEEKVKRRRNNKKNSQEQCTPTLGLGGNPNESRKEKATEVVQTKMSREEFNRLQRIKYKNLEPEKLQKRRERSRLNQKRLIERETPEQRAERLRRKALWKRNMMRERRNKRLAEEALEASCVGHSIGIELK